MREPITISSTLPALTQAEGLEPGDGWMMVQQPPKCIAVQGVTNLITYYYKLYYIFTLSIIMAVITSLLHIFTFSVIKYCYEFIITYFVFYKFIIT